MLVTVVLAVTAALVSYPPPSTGNVGPVSGSVKVGADLLEYTVDPARTAATRSTSTSSTTRPERP